MLNLTGMVRFSALFLTIISFMCGRCHAQKEFANAFTIRYVHSHSRVVNLATEFGKPGYGINLHYQHFLPVSAEKKHFAGAGVSFSGMYNNGLFYISANPDSNRNLYLGPADPDFTDTVFAPPGLEISLNLLLCYRWKILKNLELSCSADLLGFSSPRQFTAAFITLDDPMASLKTVAARNTNFNLLIPGALCKGQIRANILLRYWFNDKFGLFAGPGLWRRDIRTESSVGRMPDRFARTTFRTTAGITWAPFYRKTKPPPLIR